MEWAGTKGEGVWAEGEGGAEGTEGTECEGKKRKHGQGGAKGSGSVPLTVSATIEKNTTRFFPSFCLLASRTDLNSCPMSHSVCFLLARSSGSCSQCGQLCGKLGFPTGSSSHVVLNGQCMDLVAFRSRTRVTALI